MTGAVPRRGRLAFGGQVEDRALADQRVQLGLLPRGLGLLEHREHPLAARAGRAEGAALDQRLDRLLVDRAGVDALAEVPQRGEAPALLARALDRLDRLVADALDRVEPEADVADLRRRAGRPRPADASTVNSWSERLTSGGRISIPISSQRATKNGTLSFVDITEEISAAMYSAG